MPLNITASRLMDNRRLIWLTNDNYDEQFAFPSNLAQNEHFFNQMLTKRASDGAIDVGFKH